MGSTFKGEGASSVEVSRLAMAVEGLSIMGRSPIRVSLWVHTRCGSSVSAQSRDMALNHPGPTPFVEREN